MKDELKDAYNWTTPQACEDFLKHQNREFIQRYAQYGPDKSGKDVL